MQGSVHLEAFDGGVRVLAPAKLNLFLEVLAKRGDGFHDLETVMVSVDLYDTIRLTAAPCVSEIRFRTNDPRLPTDERNLVVQAAELLRRRSGLAHGVCIELDKRIPIEAGLGGGSSDAAAVLAGLNELWGLALGIESLTELGRELGSDVPFFLTADAGLCRGRGDRIEPLSLGASLSLVIVVPPLGVSTAAVFRSGRIDLSETRRSSRSMVEALTHGRGDAVGRELFNRLAPVARQMCPKLNALLNRLPGEQGVGREMTGSGSAHFVLCRNSREAETVATTMRATGLAEAFAVRTIG